MDDVTIENRRRIDIISDEEFLEGLADLDIDELRRRRELADAVETELSYYRRLLHGRMDLLAFELRRRSGEETRSLIEALPEILGGGETASGTGGRPTPAVMPDLPEEQRRPIDRVLADDFLARLPMMTDEDLHEVQAMLAEAETEVSTQRKSAQAAFDGIQAEILNRYKDGTADQSGLLDA
jgi:hypothetical protein